MSRFAILLAMLASLALAGGAQARQVGHPDPKYLWATVNVCDTAAHPDTIGVRASMPGIVHRERMYLRIRIEYFARGDGHWHFVRRGGDTGYRALGKGGRLVRESGASFHFQPPADGSTFVTRGVVSYRWRKHRRLLHRAERNTVHGHASSAGADPPGYSAGVCEIRP